MISSKNWTAYYKELKSTPSLFKVIILALLFFTINLAFMIIINYKYLLYYFLASILLVPASLLLKLGDKQINFRRVIALQTFNLGGIILAVIIWFTIPIYKIYFSSSFVITFSTLSYITYLFTTKSSRIKIFLIYQFIIITNMLLYLLIIIYNINNLYEIIIKLYVINILSIILVLLYLKYVGIISKKKYKFDAIKHFKGFLLTWLTKNHYYYETVLKDEKIFKKSFDVPIIKFNKKNNINTHGIALLELPIHPGPFLNVGSSDLPTILLLHNGVEIYPFHGPTTHAYDLTSSDDKNLFIKTLIDKINKIYTNQPLKISRIVKKIYNGIEVKGFKINNLIIAIVQANKEGILDDIDIKVKEEARKFAKNNGFIDLFLIDAHNSYSDNIKTCIEEINSVLLRCIKELIEELKNANCYETKIGHYKFYVPPEFRKETTGIGKVITFKLKDDIYSLILIDSNNMILELRRYIEKRLNNLVTELIICSTDSHILTASFSGKNSYYPLGYDKNSWNKLCNIIESAIKASINSVEDAIVGFSTLSTPRLKIFGDLPIIYEKATLDLIKYGKILPYLLYAVVNILIFSIYPLL